MYDNLKSLGITNPEEIDRYSLRQEANNDILKIYFQKDKGEFFAKSVKFKYPRQRKTVVADGVGQGYKEVQEISPNLRYIIDELDQICQRDRSEVDLKRKILDDLWHFCRPLRLIITLILQLCDRPPDVLFPSGEALEFPVCSGLLRMDSGYGTYILKAGCKRLAHPPAE